MIQNNASPSERRTFGRRDSSINAVVAVRGRPNVKCVVLNYSETGALIEFRDPPAAVQMFRLVIDQHGIDIVCQVRHRSPKIVGVSFVGGTIERFNELFKPVKPAEPRVRETACGNDRPAVQSTDCDAEAPTAPLAGPVELPSDTILEVVSAPSLAPEVPVSLLDELTSRIRGTPEFEAAGFRLQANDDNGEIVIYQRMIRRGAWRQDGNRLLLTPTAIGFEPLEASSVAMAMLQTMEMVLALLERRRRGVRRETSMPVDESSGLQLELAF